MTYPRFLRARDRKHTLYTGGTVTFNSTSWANWPTVTSAFALKAQVGDVLEAFLNLRLENEAVVLFLDAITTVSGTATTSFGQQSAAPTSTTGEGVRAWQDAGGTARGVSGSAFYVVQSGDLASGFVTVQFRYRTGSASNRTALSSTTLGAIMLGVVNQGPIDPN